MDSSKQFSMELFAGLKALSASTFPKTCQNCGETYDSVEDFWQKTDAVSGKTGLKISLDENDRPIVELFRNCRCGSTLMDCFNDRRDTSEKGLKRRELFGKLLAMLERKGLGAAKARTELLKMMCGEKSTVLEKMGIETQIH